MQNKKLIGLIVLGIGAISSLIYGIVTPSKVRRMASKGSLHIKMQAKVTAEKSASSASVAATGGPRKDSFTDWGRDPFSSGPPATVSEMVLTGILWDSSAPLAMINDNPVAAGDKIGGCTVVEIKKDRVILKDDTKDFELLLPSY